MARRTILIAALALAAALTTAACTAAPEEESVATPEARTPTPTATPTVESTDDPIVVNENSTAYATIEEVRTAVTAGGVPCDGWAQKDAVEGASASGTCANGMSLALFADGAARDASLNADQMSSDPGLWLVGRNWLVGYPEGGEITDLDPLLASLGGFVVPTGS